MIKWLLIFSFILEKVVDGVIHYLDSKYMEKSLPENVKDVYNEEEYLNWKSYEKEGGRLDFISDLISTGLLFLFLAFNWYAGIFDFLSVYPLYLQYLFFIIIMIAMMLPIELPFDYYNTFVIEEKYGLNNMTKRTFWLDQLKDFLIALGVSYGIFVILIFSFERFGNLAIVVAIIAIVVVSLVVAALIVPLMRIYNKFTPLRDEELLQKLHALCEKYQVEVKKVVVKDASRRTTKSNAFCAGIGKKKTISLDDNLVNNYSSDQIVAVFAHEFAHARGKHVWKSLPFGLFRTVLIMVALGIVLNFPVLFQAFGFQETNYFFAMTLIEMISWPLTMLLAAIGNYISRKHEYEADAFAAREGYGEALIGALKQLSKESLSDINPHPLVVKLEYDHPTLSQRIAAIREEEANANIRI